MNVSLLNYEPTVRLRIRSGEFANASEYIRHCIRVAELVEARSGPRGASFATRQELEGLLDDGMESPDAPVTANRKRLIYQRART
jgi:Arc/MetJ-type ribon-helix-helix transcriptional regulator